MDIWGIVFGSDGTFEDGAEVATAAAEDETVGAVVAPVTLTVVLGLIDIWGMVFGSDGTLDDGAADADVAAADDGVITSTKGMVTIVFSLATDLPQKYYTELFEARFCRSPNV